MILFSLKKKNWKTVWDFKMFNNSYLPDYNSVSWSFSYQIWLILCENIGQDIAFTIKWSSYKSKFRKNIKTFSLLYILDCSSLDGIHLEHMTEQINDALIKVFRYRKNSSCKETFFSSLFCLYQWITLLVNVSLKILLHLILRNRVGTCSSSKGSVPQSKA